jgi:hypothetical protein
LTPFQITICFHFHFYIPVVCILFYDIITDSHKYFQYGVAMKIVLIYATEIRPLTVKLWMDGIEKKCEDSTWILRLSNFVLEIFGFNLTCNCFSTSSWTFYLPLFTNFISTQLGRHIDNLFLNAIEYCIYIYIYIYTVNDKSTGITLLILHLYNFFATNNHYVIIPMKMPSV